MIINGILNINKPKDISSFDVIRKIKKITGLSKVGHAGTLDPIATGVLLVCIGEATKVVQYLMDADKEYMALAVLGKTTDTQDYTGKVLTSGKVETVSDENIENILNEYRGEIKQIPPMYSALHYKGERLYNLARKDIEVAREARNIKIKNLTLIERDLVKIKFLVECSKGTYIRTLCNDIGTRIGCGAYLEELIRTRSGNYKLEDSIELSEIKKAEDVAKFIVPINEALCHFENITVKEGKEVFVKHGTPINQSYVEENISALGNNTFIKIFSSNKELLAIGEKNIYNQDILIRRGFNML
ncbi:tRNA pseudouridine(55) synthase TruB [Candidatus Desantisbacteria bacterium]|nr:tRNA pseudouridine(55) synthase TruB [Candidatus Desantisbacteria bacterium]